MGRGGGGARQARQRLHRMPASLALALPCLPACCIPICAPPLPICLPHPPAASCPTCPTASTRQTPPRRWRLTTIHCPAGPLSGTARGVPSPTSWATSECCVQRCACHAKAAALAGRRGCRGSVASQLKGPTNQPAPRPAPSLQLWAAARLWGMQWQRRQRRHSGWVRQAPLLPLPLRSLPAHITSLPILPARPPACLPARLPAPLCCCQLTPPIVSFAPPCRHPRAGCRHQRLPGCPGQLPWPARPGCCFQLHGLLR